MTTFKKIVYIIVGIIIGLTTGGGVRGVYCTDAPIEVFKYESKGRRDPFIPLIGQERVKGTGLENITSIQDVNLEGIAIGASGKNIAILNGRMVRENDKFGVLEIKKISQKTIQLSIDGNNHTLNLREPEKGR